jgi:hypothetical protein
VVVDYEKRDRYERILGKVQLDGEDVNLEQIRAGLAWHYEKYQGEQTVSDRVAYSDAEMEARRQKLGLWSDTAAMPPWDRNTLPTHLHSLESPTDLYASEPLRRTALAWLSRESGGTYPGDNS